jgi:GNAT superfamily N-acetyltransferase
MIAEAPCVAPLAEADLPEALPLIAEYQRFYRAASIDEERNRRFFSGFLAPSEAGLLFGARLGDRLGGFGCVYWTYSSVRAQRIGLLNDLFVAPWARGGGVGLSLVEHAREASAQRGIEVLRWWTEIDNRQAQRLYERLPVNRSAWFEYELAVD